MSEWQRSEFRITTDRSQLDVSLIHDFLSTKTYWATGRKRDVVQRSIDNSLCFGVFLNRDEQTSQIGFARVVTDYATFAWIADVFIIEEYRGQGLGTWLINIIISHPDLKGFRRWVLATKDAHELYRRVGFHELHRPERWMERPDVNMHETPDYWNPKSSEA